MKTFTAIDFETAQGYRWSICQVGIVRVVEGEITDAFSVLVQPPGNYYWKQFTDIHGISAKNTRNAPTFDKVWPSIEPFITNQSVVAHNGLGFDFPVLAKTLDYYGIPVPDYQKHCTYKLYRKGLAQLCHEKGIYLDHHNALSDAKACAELYLGYLK